MKPEIKLSLSIDDINIIGAALRKMPWDVADPVIRKLDGQIRKAMEPKPEAKDSTPVADQPANGVEAVTG